MKHKTYLFLDLGTVNAPYAAALKGAKKGGKV